MKTTSIEWCDSTHNYWRGCQKVSPGCTNCYAEARAKRFGEDFSKRIMITDFEAPLRWNKKPRVCSECGKAVAIGMDVICDCGSIGFHRRRVFSLSLGDFFDPAVPIEDFARALDVMRRADQIDHLIVTKRPELWEERVSAIVIGQAADTRKEVRDAYKKLAAWCMDWIKGRAPHNIWIIATAEDQDRANERIPALLKIPATVRGLSIEPLLGPVDLQFQGEDALECTACRWKGVEGDCKSRDEGDDTIFVCPECWEDCAHVPIDELRGNRGIDWVIIGGESGQNARPCNIDWIRSLVNQCKTANVPVFVKQLGANPQTEDAACRAMEKQDGHKRAWKHIFTDKKGGDMREWSGPLEDLRLRQFPRGCRREEAGSASQITDRQSSIVNRQ